VYFFLPETNGKSLEDMDLLFGFPGFARAQMKAFDEMKLLQMAEETEGIKGALEPETENMVMDEKV